MPSAPLFEDGDDVFTGGHHQPLPHGLPQQTTEPLPPGATGYAGLPPGAYGQQANVAGALPGFFVRQDSGIMAPCGPPTPIYEPPGSSSDGVSMPGENYYGGVHINVNGARGACPSCSSGVCAPPTYDESLQHQILHQ